MAGASLMRLRKSMGVHRGDAPAWPQQGAGLAPAALDKLHGNLYISGQRKGGRSPLPTMDRLPVTTTGGNHPWNNLKNL